MQWECNAWAYNIKSTTPQQFHKNLKNPKIFQKPQNLGLKCMNAIKWGFKNTYQVIEAWFRPKITRVEGFEWKKSVSGERKEFLSRENEI